MVEDVLADLVQINVYIRRGGINWEQILDLSVDRGAWWMLTALCAVSTGGSNV